MKEFALALWPDVQRRLSEEYPEGFTREQAEKIIAEVRIMRMAETAETKQ